MTELSETAARLRQEFDRSFVEPPPPPAPATLDLLAIRVGKERLALRLSEIAGLFLDRTITALPTPLRGLLGVASFRGAIVPVYDLGSILGLPATQSPRYLVVSAGTPIAFAFDGLDAHLRVAAAEIARDQQPGSGLTPEIVRAPSPRPLVSLAALVTEISSRVRAASSGKEG